MNCKATWTTVTTTNDVVAYVSDRGCETRAENTVPDGVAVVRDGDRLLRLDVTTLTCSGWHPLGPDVHTFDPDDEDHPLGFIAWTDAHPNATSHADNTPPADEREPCDQADGFVCTLPHVWVDGQAYHSEEPYSTPPAGTHYCSQAKRFVRPDEPHAGVFSSDKCIGCPPADVCPATRSGDACIKAPGHDGLHAYKADVCDNPDCEGGSVPNPSAPTARLLRLPCPTCKGTDDRPAVTDARVAAAVRALQSTDGWSDINARVLHALRAADCAALEAAAAERSKQ